jgi:hypothetical protein
VQKLRAGVASSIFPAFLLLPPPAILAQALRLSSAAARQGESVVIEFSLISPKGQEPQVLQWETTIPATQLAFTGQELQAGPMAKAAGKSFVCAAKTNTPETRTLVCILAGGLKTISNGIIGRVRLRILPEAAPGAAPVHTDRGIAVLKGLKQIPLPPAETLVAVRRAPEAPHPGKK